MNQKIKTIPLILAALVLFNFHVDPAQASVFDWLKNLFRTPAAIEQIINQEPAEKSLPITTPYTPEAITPAEVITKEVPTEKIITKEVIKEVPVEKIITKEVPVEKIVTKEVIKEVPAECPTQTCPAQQTCPTCQTCIVSQQSCPVCSTCSNEQTTISSLQARISSLESQLAVLQSQIQSLSSENQTLRATTQPVNVYSDLQPTNKSVAAQVNLGYPETGGTTIELLSLGDMGGRSLQLRRISFTTNGNPQFYNLKACKVGVSCSGQGNPILGSNGSYYWDGQIGIDQAYNIVVTMAKQGCTTTLNNCKDGSLSISVDLTDWVLWDVSANKQIKLTGSQTIAGSYQSP